MGTGKTSVSHLAAEMLRFGNVDTDELIQKRAGRSISDIFLAEGEARFRQYESTVIRELECYRHTVISTGGGIGANPEHLASLKRHALTVCLWASPERIWERVKGQSHRPLLQNDDPLGAIRTMLSQREQVYRQADVLVNTEMRPIREVAFQVVHHFRAALRAAASE